MKIVIDPTRCTGHGRCYALAPEVFAPDAVGQSELVADADIPDALAQRAQLAIDNCPEHAISVLE